MRSHTYGRGQPGLPRWPQHGAVGLISRPGKPRCCRAAWRPLRNHSTAAMLHSSPCQARVSSWNGAEELNCLSSFWLHFQQSASSAGPLWNSSTRLGPIDSGFNLTFRPCWHPSLAQHHPRQHRSRGGAGGGRTQ